MLWIMLPSMYRTCHAWVLPSRVEAMACHHVASSFLCHSFKRPTRSKKHAATACVAGWQKECACAHCSDESLESVKLKCLKCRMCGKPAALMSFRAWLWPACYEFVKNGKMHPSIHDSRYIYTHIHIRTCTYIYIKTYILNVRIHTYTYMLY